MKSLNSSYLHTFMINIRSETNEHCMSRGSVLKKILVIVGFLTLVAGLTMEDKKGQLQYNMGYPWGNPRKVFK